MPPVSIDLMLPTAVTRNIKATALINPETIVKVREEASSELKICWAEMVTRNSSSETTALVDLDPAMMRDDTVRSG